MKESLWGVAITTIGIISITAVFFFQSLTNTNEHNYTLLKEATEAAMIDSVDLAYYRQTGVVKIQQEKFVENFVRRFSESASLANTYKIEIYDINESPAKVSLKVSSVQGTSLSGEIVNFNISNKIDAILESID